jgi:hypothetical protein
MEEMNNLSRGGKALDEGNQEIAGEGGRKQNSSEFSVGWSGRQLLEYAKGLELTPSVHSLTHSQGLGLKCNKTEERESREGRKNVSVEANPNPIKPRRGGGGEEREAHGQIERKGSRSSQLCKRSPRSTV